MLWESVVKFADSLQPQSPFEETLPFSGKEYETAGSLSTLMCSRMGFQDPFKRKEKFDRMNTGMTPKVEEKKLILIPSSSLSPWLYPVFLSFYFVSDFSPP
jgi:hypothetical protein